MMGGVIGEDFVCVIVDDVVCDYFLVCKIVYYVVLVVDDILYKV